LLAGKASEYIETLSLRLGDKVVIVVRVSKQTQADDDNLDDQSEDLHVIPRMMGAKVIYEHAYVGSGWTPDLYPAVTTAMDAGNGGPWPRNKTVIPRPGFPILLARDTSRFVRNADYHPAYNPLAVPTVQNFRDLRRQTRGPRLMTVLHPDASPEEIMSVVQAQGKYHKDHWGGRPIKGRGPYRDKWISMARELYEEG
jgi:hypothetical protein